VIAFCNAPSNLTQFDSTQSIGQTARTLQIALNQLPENTIPIGCKLDLPAIAQTIIAENPLPTPTATPLPTATPASLSRLRLTSMCSDEPANVRVWRVRNTNPVDVLATWQVVGTSQTNSLTVPASSDAFFQTVTVSGPNTTRILVNNIQQDVKASGGAQCSS